MFLFKDSLFILMAFSFSVAVAQGADRPVYWIKVKAANLQTRTQIAKLGVAIEDITSEYVVVIGTAKDLSKLKENNFETQSFVLAEPIAPPASKNAESPGLQFHNYAAILREFEFLRNKYHGILNIFSIGKTVEGRDIFAMEITNPSPSGLTKPGVLFIGTHHSREHISTETPLLLAEYFLKKYAAGDMKIRHLVQTRDIYFIPLLNPDGAEFDVQGVIYKFWRKNRARNAGGTFGVDLNRNYDYAWGGDGASDAPDSEVYQGPSAFSEPETRSLRDFIESHRNIKVLASYHTYGSLILYPWSAVDAPIKNEKDLAVFKTMAHQIAIDTGYTDEQSSALYPSSGDTCDWAYAKYNLFAFTFELDPTYAWAGGFYPGANSIEKVYEKNIKPAIYLTEYADDPYRVVTAQAMASRYGLSSEYFFPLPSKISHLPEVASVIYFGHGAP